LEVFSFTEFEIFTEEVQTAGDWAYARGNYTALLDMKESGDQVPLDGKFLTIFEQQSDGSWLIHRDIFNSNVP
jgi:ketosteroid isomerase-like protein